MDNWKKNLTHEEFLTCLKGCRSFLKEVVNADSDKLDFVVVCIVVPNTILVMEGCGLSSRKQIAELRLENARLLKKDLSEIKKLEDEFCLADSDFQRFLENAHFAD